MLRSIFLKVYVVRSLCILHAAYSHTIDRGHKTKQTVEIRRWKKSYSSDKIANISVDIYTKTEEMNHSGETA